MTWTWVLTYITIGLVWTRAITLRYLRRPEGAVSGLSFVFNWMLWPLSMVFFIGLFVGFSTARRRRASRVVDPAPELDGEKISEPGGASGPADAGSGPRNSTTSS